MSWLDQVCVFQQTSESQLLQPVERAQSDLKTGNSSLVERVAKALDRASDFEYVDTLYLIQQVDTVRLGGIAPSADVVERLVAIATQVEGVSQIDTSRVIVENGWVYSGR
ncbi:hypothetical protein IQ241_11490 [Romeria aff. gracilis LEGE 07310]|uniref:BON domain-containing protein n=1 Tax=Vasconcelosia minhoensis LEGE 07310 TaxID=915328 RepID=A0A8J7AHZ8_9CYAN|nr:hypothetical protein [Romeria gracilis]MBE9077908.1 hypothetical protein [Romeria aff. gracilis LEGE 07310]